MGKITLEFSNRMVFVSIEILNRRDKSQIYDMCFPAMIANAKTNPLFGNMAKLASITSLDELQFLSDFDIVSESLYAQFFIWLFDNVRGRYNVEDPIGLTVIIPANVNKNVLVKNKIKKAALSASAQSVSFTLRCDALYYGYLSLPKNNSCLIVDLGHDYAQVSVIGRKDADSMIVQCKDYDIISDSDYVSYILSSLLTPREGTSDSFDISTTALYSDADNEVANLIYEELINKSDAKYIIPGREGVLSFDLESLLNQTTTQDKLNRLTRNCSVLINESKTFMDNEICSVHIFSRLADNPKYKEMVGQSFNSQMISANKLCFHHIANHEWCSCRGALNVSNDSKEVTLIYG